MGRPTGPGLTAALTTVLTPVLGVVLAACLFLTVDRTRLVGLVPGLTGASVGGATASMVLTTAAWLLFLGAAVVARPFLARLRPGTARWVVLVGGLLIGLAALSAPPATSNDSARYAWDGIVQRAGISPYTYAPADPALTALRPDWLVGAQSPGGGCDPGRFPSDPTIHAGQCFAINRPTVPTIYPPIAELYFLLVRVGLPAQVGFIAFQVAGLLLVLGATVVLLRLMPRRPHRALWWAWCPAVAMEGVNNAHVDLLGAVLLLVAVLLLARGRVSISAVAFGAAVATKVLPALAGVGMLYRRPGRFVLVAVGTFVALYVPYLLWSGAAVLGYLPGYLREEGYSSSGQTTRFALLTTVLPPTVAAVAGVVLIAVLAAVLWWRWGRAAPAGATAGPWDAQCLFLAFALLIATPSYPWYALPLVPLAVLSGRWESLGVPLALTVMYNYAISDDRYAWTRGAAAAAVLLLLAGTVARWVRARGAVASAAGTPGGTRPSPERGGVLERADDDGAARPRRERTGELGDLRGGDRLHPGE